MCLYVHGFGVSVVGAGMQNALVNSKTQFPSCRYWRRALQSGGCDETRLRLDPRNRLLPARTEIVNSGPNYLNGMGLCCKIFTSQSNHQSSPHPSSFFFVAAPSPAALALLVFLIALVPTVLFCAGGVVCSPALGTPKLSQKSFRAGSTLAPDPDRVAAAAAALSCPSTNL